MKGAVNKWETYEVCKKWVSKYKCIYTYYVIIINAKFLVLKNKNETWTAYEEQENTYEL